MPSARFIKLTSQGHQRGHDNKSREALYDIDDPLASKAVEVFESNVFSMFVCMLSGLLSLMYIPSVATVLEATKQSDTNVKAFLRYLGTLNHMLQWYDTSADKRVSSLKKVRGMHMAANKKSPMSQFDMVVTQWAFVGPVLLFPQKLGMGQLKDEELQALSHLMYHVGQALGVDDDLNLCSHKRVSNTKQYCQEILDLVIVPAMDQSGEQAEVMAEHLLTGMTLFNPFITHRSYLAWTFRLLGAKTWMKRRDDTNNNMFDWVLYTLLCALFENILTYKLARLVLKPLLHGLLKTNIFLANKLTDDILHDYRRTIIVFMVYVFLGLVVLSPLIICVAIFSLIRM